MYIYTISCPSLNQNRRTVSKWKDCHNYMLNRSLNKGWPLKVIGWAERSQGQNFITPSHCPLPSTWKGCENYKLSSSDNIWLLKPTGWPWKFKGSKYYRIYTIISSSPIKTRPWSFYWDHICLYGIERQPQNFNQGD